MTRKKLERVHWQVGRVRITSIVEQDLHALNAIMPLATPEKLAEFPWLQPHYADDQGVMSGLIQALIIDTGEQRIVVDTCVGDGRERLMIEDWNHQQLDALSQFSEAGYPPNSIDYVLCTHLHVDHVGWNTRFDGTHFVPTFPNARYLFGREEFEFWQRDALRGMASPPAQDEAAQVMAAFKAMQQTCFADSVLPVMQAGLVDLVETDHRICEQVSLLSTPGHSPGHVSVLIEDQDEKALITGDAMHHPCQIAAPGIFTLVDEYPDQSIETRRWLVESASQSKHLVIGTHFSRPSGGHIHPEGSGYRFEPARHETST